MNIFKIIFKSNIDMPFQARFVKANMLIFISLLLVVLHSCDIPSVGQYKFKCTTSAECANGYICHPSKGYCIKVDAIIQDKSQQHDTVITEDINNKDNKQNIDFIEENKSDKNQIIIDVTLDNATDNDIIEEKINEPDVKIDTQPELTETLNPEIFEDIETKVEDMFTNEDTTHKN